VIAGLGCGDDGGGIVTTSDTDGGTGDPTTTSTTSTTTTSTDTGDPESDGLGPCRPVVSNAGSLTPAEYVPYEIDLAEVCNDDLLDVGGIAHINPQSGSDVLRVQDPLDENPDNNDNFRVLVYAPDTHTPLPEALPFVLFSPGVCVYT